MTETQTRVFEHLEALGVEWRKNNEGWSYGSVAESLGMPRSTVQNAVSCLRGVGKDGEAKTEVDRVGNKLTVSYDGYDEREVEEIVRGAVKDHEQWTVTKATVRNRETATGRMVYGRTVYLEPKPDPVVINVIRVDKVPIPKRKVNLDVHVAVLLSDTHFGYDRNVVTGELEPYCDRRAIDVGLQIIQDLNPNRVIHLGDVIDATEVSRWEDSREAEQFMTMMPAAVETSYLFDRIARITDAEIEWLPGNHDIRWEKVLRKNAPALVALRRVGDGPESHPVMSIAHVCGLDNLRVRAHDLYPKGKFWINDNLCVIHGTRASGTPGGTALALLRDYQCSVIQGHKHCGEQVYTSSQGKGRHKTRVATVAHCLARLDGIVPGTTPDNNWTNGITVVYYRPGDGEFHVVNVPIIRGRAVFQGKLYEGEDYADDLSGYCGWKFPFLKGNYQD